MPPTEQPNWTAAVRDHRATAEYALESLAEAARRVQNARDELASARRDRDTLIARIAASEILPKTQIADAAGVSRSRLYPNGNNIATPTERTSA